MSVRIYHSCLFVAAHFVLTVGCMNEPARQAITNHDSAPSGSTINNAPQSNLHQPADKSPMLEQLIDLDMPTNELIWSSADTRIAANILAAIGQFAYAEKSPSSCYGTIKDGRLENGWQLPSSGKNFEVYSSLSVILGRNYVHSKVYEVVVAAYKTLESLAPEKIFVYGESGFKEGGRFRPHKTHANGLSVDFFVPVVNESGGSVKLPVSLLNKFGYSIEFNQNAQYNDLALDFEAMAKHLLAVKQAADAQGVGISIVIFDNSFQEKLFATTTGKKLPEIMNFSVKKPWVRHDEHYHIDFEVKCAVGR